IHISLAEQLIMLNQILMLSGVGPSDHLKEHGISLVRDLPGVGSNLIDHPIIDLYFKDRLGLSVKWMRPKSFVEAGKLITAIFKYTMFRKGPLATNVYFDQ